MITSKNSLKFCHHRKFFRITGVEWAAPWLWLRAGRERPEERGLPHTVDAGQRGEHRWRPAELQGQSGPVQPVCNPHRPGTRGRPGSRQPGGSSTPHAARKRAPRWWDRGRAGPECFSGWTQCESVQQLPLFPCIKPFRASTGPSVWKEIAPD